MSKRREGRETAIQFLYSRDINASSGGTEFDDFWQVHSASRIVRKIAMEFASGVIEHIDEVDEKIAESVDNYSMDRLSAVDRNILRLATYEFFFRTDIPPMVTLNEAIEIAKGFGTTESASFVNGILDRLIKKVDRPLREALT